MCIEEVWGDHTITIGRFAHFKSKILSFRERKSLFVPLFDDVSPHMGLIEKVSKVVICYNHPICLLRMLQHKSVGAEKIFSPFPTVYGKPQC